MSPMFLCHCSLHKWTCRIVIQIRFMQEDKVGDERMIGRVHDSVGSSQPQCVC